MADVSPEFIQTLRDASSPVKATRVAANENLQAMSASNLDLYVQMLTQTLLHEDPSIREYAIVLLRMKCVTAQEEFFQTAFNAETQALVKGALLHCAINETADKVRVKVAHMIGALGSLLIREGQWPEIESWLGGASGSDNAQIRATALRVYASLGTFAGAHFASSFATIAQLLHREIFEEPDFEVRLLALRTTATFMSSVTTEEDRAIFKPLMPGAMAIVQECLKNPEHILHLDDGIRLLIDMASADALMFDEILGQATNFFCSEIAMDSNQDDDTRMLALEWCLVIAQHAASLCRATGDGFVGAVFPVIMNFLATYEDCEEFYSGANYHDDSSLEYYAQEAALRLGNALHGAGVLPVANPAIMEAMASEHHQMRYAALMALSFLGRGCRVALEDHLASLIEMIIPAFQDESPRVRVAACTWVYNACDDYDGALQKEHGLTVLEALVPCLQDTVHRVQADAVTALIMFSQGAGAETLMPHAENILNVLMTMLKADTPLVRGQAVTAIATCASSLQEDFVPYYATVMPALQTTFEEANGDGCAMLRGKLFEAMGLLASSVGRAVFLPDAENVINVMFSYASQDLPPSDPQREYIISAWSRVAMSLQEDFLPFLPKILPGLLEAAEQVPEAKISEITLSSRKQESKFKQFTIGDKIVSLRTTQLEEKSSALAALVEIMKSLGAKIGPDLIRIVALLVSSLDFHFMPTIRTISAVGFPVAMSALAEVEVAGGVPSGTIDALWGHAVSTLMEVVELESMAAPRYHMMNALNSTIPELVGLFGDGILDASEVKSSVAVMKALFEDFVATQQKIAELKATSKYQDDLGMQDMEELEEDENDFLQLLSTTCGTMYSHFPLFREFFATELLPSLTILAQSPNKFDRLMSMFVFVDCIPEGGAQFLPVFGPVLAELALSEEKVYLQPSLYGIQLLALHAPEAFSAHAEVFTNACLKALQNPAAMTKNMRAATDNAAVALARILAVSGGSTVADPAATWALLMGFFPIVSDLEEAGNMCNIMLGELNKNNPQFMGLNNCNLPVVLKSLSTFYGDAENGNDNLDKELAPAILQIVQIVGPETSNAVFGSLVRSAQLKIQELLSA